jgi:hypothetical protein
LHDADQVSPRGAGSVAVIDAGKTRRAGKPYKPPFSAVLRPGAPHNFRADPDEPLFRIVRRIGEARQ